MNKHPTGSTRGGKHDASMAQTGRSSGRAKPSDKGKGKTEQPLVSAAPQPTWTRYADSRLKQFCLR